MRLSRARLGVVAAAVGLVALLMVVMASASASAPPPVARAAAGVPKHTYIDVEPSIVSSLDPLVGNTVSDAELPDSILRHTRTAPRGRLPGRRRCRRLPP